MTRAHFRVARLHIVRATNSFLAVAYSGQRNVPFIGRTGNDIGLFQTHLGFAHGGTTRQVVRRNLDSSFQVGGRKVIVQAN